MLIVIAITYIVVFLPLVSFLVAAVAELQSPQRGSAVFLRPREIAGGIIFWAVHYEY